MQTNLRQAPRRIARATYSTCWQDEAGLTKSAEVEGLDLSDSGIGFKSLVELHPGTKVFIEGQDGHPKGYGVVRHCTRRDVGYAIGLELDEEARKTVARPVEGVTDYYELLQISPKADRDTIHRVHRFLAARYHPDNPETGDPEKFVLLQRAVEVLSDPKHRAAYDLARQMEEAQPVPMSASVDFMDGIQGEVNRRLALLSVLYNRRRMSPDAPEVTLAEVEVRLGFPREYLDFTTWYLKSKKYITKADNSDFTLTALGVDYVEANCLKIPILNRLLTSGTGAATTSKAAAGSTDMSSSDRVLVTAPGEEAASDVGAPGEREREF
jgi:curved DNA-binding protein